jgi:hypothetical protein
MERDFPQGIDAEDMCAPVLTCPRTQVTLGKATIKKFTSRSVRDVQQHAGVPALRPGLHKLLKDANPEVVLVPSSPALFLNIMPLACSYAKAVVCAQLGPPLEQLLWKGYLQHLAWFLVPYDTGMMLVHKISNPDPALTETWLYIFPRRARHNYLTLDIPNSALTFSAIKTVK